MILGHGGDIYGAARAIGCRPEDILDFSSNVNPLPLKHEFLRFLQDQLHSIRHLPEPDSLELRKKLASRYGIPPDNLLVGPGTTQWIFDLPGLFAMERVVVVVPTYADYEDAARMAGKDVHRLGTFPLQGPLGPQWLMEIIKGLRPGDLIFLCNPNNPTGAFIDPAVLKDVMMSTPGVTWCVDESYAPFIAPYEDTSVISLGIPQNCMVLRSLSKIHGIPGLRLGAIFGHIHSMEKLSRHQRPWAVARISQLAGLYLINRGEWESEAREYLMREKAYLFNAIQHMPRLHPIESHTHFFLIKVDPALNVSTLCKLLLKKKMLIRDCSNFRGLEDKNIARISPRTHQENEMLIEALGHIMSSMDTH